MSTDSKDKAEILVLQNRIRSLMIANEQLKHDNELLIATVMEMDKSEEPDSKIVLN